jgi:hypothetical protein
MLKNRAGSMDDMGWHHSNEAEECLESTLDSIKQKRALTEGLDIERIRGRLNQMIDQQIQQRGAR